MQKINLAVNDVQIQKCNVALSKVVFCWVAWLGWLSRGGCVVTMPRAVVMFWACVWTAWRSG